MTYCLGICVADGIVFASDSRTNAGVDYASVYSKMHDFKPAPDRQFMLLSSGNLALSQEILNHLRRDLDHPGRLGNLVTARYLFEAAVYVGQVSLEVQGNHRAALLNSGLSPDVTLIFGGSDRRRAPPAVPDLSPGQLCRNLQRYTVPTDRRNQVR